MARVTLFGGEATGHRETLMKEYLAVLVAHQQDIHSQVWTEVATLVVLRPLLVEMAPIRPKQQGMMLTVTRDLVPVVVEVVHDATITPRKVEMVQMVWWRLNM